MSELHPQLLKKSSILDKIRLFEPPSNNGGNEDGRVVITRPRTKSLGDLPSSSSSSSSSSPRRTDGNNVKEKINSLIGKISVAGGTTTSASSTPTSSCAAASSSSSSYSSSASTSSSSDSTPYTSSFNSTSSTSSSSGGADELKDSPSVPTRPMATHIFYDKEESPPSTSTNNCLQSLKDKGKQPLQSNNEDGEDYTNLRLLSDKGKQPLQSNNEDGEDYANLCLLSDKGKEPLQSNSEDGEDYANLRLLSDEEKQMVKRLVEATRSKNIRMENMEETHRQEMQKLTLQSEEDKISMLKELRRMQKELEEKEKALHREAILNLDLREKLGDAQNDLQAAQAAVESGKTAYDEYKRTATIALNKQSQKLLHMDEQIKILTKIRDSLECVVCEEHAAKIVVLPCRHMVLCTKCATLCRQCPMCRAAITHTLEVYLNWVM